MRAFGISLTGLELSGTRRKLLEIKFHSRRLSAVYDQSLQAPVREHSAVVIMI